MQFKELGSNYLITLETIGNSDEMLIEVELSDLFTDDYSALQRLTKGITRQLKDELLLTHAYQAGSQGIFANHRWQGGTSERSSQALLNKQLK